VSGVGSPEPVDVSASVSVVTTVEVQATESVASAAPAVAAATSLSLSSIMRTWTQEAHRHPRATFRVIRDECAAPVGTIEAIVTRESSLDDVVGRQAFEPGVPRTKHTYGIQILLNFVYRCYLIRAWQFE
jgi:prophage DNA circulation protein